MKRVAIYICFIFFWCFTLPGNSNAEDGFTQKDRELLIELKIKINEIDKRFEQVDKRFEQIDKRFGELREDMNKRFEQMFNFLWILASIFTTFTVTLMGLVYWDRRTIIKTAKRETIEEIEKQGLSVKLLEILRELAKEDNKVANVLRQFHLL